MPPIGEKVIPGQMVDNNFTVSLEAGAFLLVASKTYRSASKR